MKNAIYAALCSATLIFATPLLARDYRLVPDPSVPAAAGTVKVDKDKNGNYKVKLEVHHMARPSALTPPRQAYVVWVQVRGGQPENDGQLKVNDKLDATLETTTPHEQFDVFITAEQDPSTQSPTGPELMHGSIVP